MIEANRCEKLKAVKDFSAPVDTAYRAWTEPEQLKQWWRPMGNFLSEVTNDLKEGGKIEYKFKGSDPMTFAITGEYIQVIPNVKLVYTWNWFTQGSAIKDSAYKLTVNFRSTRFGSSIEILQEHVNDQECIFPHQHGWEEALMHLARYVDSTDDPQSAEAALGHS